MLPQEGQIIAMSCQAKVSAVALATAVWFGCAPGALALNLPVPTDKVAHFGVSYILTDQLIRMGARPEEAIGATLFVGWLKEVVDKPFDPYDLAADAAGSLMAAYVRVQFKF
jgi:hypothetical protein